MKDILLVTQIIIGMLIVGAVLLQAQGSGLGSTWGGGGETYHTKRGVEKVVFIFTIVAVAVFILVSVAVLAI